MNITEICAYCKNYFLKSIVVGEFEISNSTITGIEGIKEGQYFRICGSDLNDGVYLNTEDGLSDLRDETFSGSVWLMSVPPAFIDICKDIIKWREKYESADSVNMSPFTSESVSGVYSYSKSGGGNSGGANTTWQTAFKSRLIPYRRVSER